MADSQPPEGLLGKIAEKLIAADQYDLGYPLPNGACNCQECCERVTRAVLAALFEACEVREDFPLTCTTPYSKLPREVVHKTREGAVSDARGYARDGFMPVKVEHRWTLRYSHPVMRIDDDGEPVSSTGEEKTDGG